MSKDREEELPGNVHGPRISCPLSATSTKHSLTDGRDEDLGSCKDVTVRIQSIVSGAPTFTIGMMFSIASNSEFESEIIWSSYTKEIMGMTSAGDTLQVNIDRANKLILNNTKLVRYSQLITMAILQYAISYS